MKVVLFTICLLIAAGISSCHSKGSDFKHSKESDSKHSESKHPCDNDQDKIILETYENNNDQMSSLESKLSDKCLSFVKKHVCNLKSYIDLLTKLNCNDADKSLFKTYDCNENLKLFDTLSDTCLANLKNFTKQMKNHKNECENEKNKKVFEKYFQKENCNVSVLVDLTDNCKKDIKNMVSFMGKSNNKMLENASCNQNDIDLFRSFDTQKDLDQLDALSCDCVKGLKKMANQHKGKEHHKESKKCNKPEGQKDHKKSAKCPCNEDDKKKIQEFIENDSASLCDLKVSDECSKALKFMFKMMHNQKNHGSYPSHSGHDSHGSRPSNKDSSEAHHNRFGETITN